MRLTRTRRHPRDYSLATIGDHGEDTAPEADAASTELAPENATEGDTFLPGESGWYPALQTSAPPTSAPLPAPPVPAPPAPRPAPPVPAPPAPALPIASLPIPAPPVPAPPPETAVEIDAGAATGVDPGLEVDAGAEPEVEDEIVLVPSGRSSTTRSRSSRARASAWATSSSSSDTWASAFSPMCSPNSSG
jgi:hypothetical protein